jgi:allophanate hydrolase subunit 1
MPGWGYLTGLSERLAVPRRAEPKAQVVGGSVLIAAAMSAVLPLPSPTGWHVLGRTERVLFSLDREPHCLLACGDRVRFREVRT